MRKLTFNEFVITLLLLPGAISVFMMLSTDGSNGLILAAQVVFQFTALAFLTRIVQV